jgi:hypothetical protein
VFLYRQQRVMSMITYKKLLFCWEKSGLINKNTHAIAYAIAYAIACVLLSITNN